MKTCRLVLSLVAVGLAALPVGAGQESDRPQPGNAATVGKSPASKAIPASGDLVPLNEKKTVLVDRTRKAVLLKTRVCNREVLLEMFCCRLGTKEHESILAVDANAYVVHSALLAVGAKPGKPAQYVPSYKPASGQRIDMFVSWKDKDGKQHRRPARDWVRHAVNRYYVKPLEKLPEGVEVPIEELRYDDRIKELLWFGPMSDKQRDELLALSKDAEYQAGINQFYKQSQPRPMDAHWLFSGSGFFVDDQTGEKYYMAEGGWIVCVANLPEAVMDVSVESSDVSGSLLYEGWAERIPPLGTEVTLELIPAPDKPTKPAAEKKPKRGAAVPTSTSAKSRISRPCRTLSR